MAIDIYQELDLAGHALAPSTNVCPQLLTGYFLSIEKRKRHFEGSNSSLNVVIKVTPAS